MAETSFYPLGPLSFVAAQNRCDNRNGRGPALVRQSMRIVARCGALAVTAFVLARASAPSADYTSAKRKLASIQAQHLPPGSVVTFTPREIEAWARIEVPKEIPEGFRDPGVQLREGSGTGRALVDLLRMRHAKGQETNWFVSKLIEGERPVVASIRLQSAGGWCKVDLTRVEISGVAATGSVLDFLVRTFSCPSTRRQRSGNRLNLDIGLSGWNCTRRVFSCGLAVRPSRR